MEGNPVLHEWPARRLSPTEMHSELIKPHHAACRPDTCQMIDYCRKMLLEMAHTPDEPMSKCPACLCSSPRRQHPSATGGVWLTDPPSF